MRVYCISNYFTLLTCAAVSIYVVACGRLPFGIEDHKFQDTLYLGRNIETWKKRGSIEDELTFITFTKENARVSRYETNIIVEGRNYQIILRLDAKYYRGKGCMLASRDGTVIWYATDGKYKVSSPPMH